MPLASAALAYGGVAHAQQADTGAQGLEEVIVTAQKRTEDVQKVPISIQVLSGEKLDELQVKDFMDFAKFMPSVSFTTLGPSQSEIYFRGISTGSNNLHAGYLPSTGLYLDEIPVTTVSSSLDIHVYDIERVEGLAGPQGTLYGANSLAGTLRIITNKPDHKGTYGGLDIKGTKFGDGEGGGSLEGFVNYPLNDKVAVRLVGYYEHDGGYTSNVPTSVKYLRTQTLPDDTTVDHPVTIENTPIVNHNGNDIDSYGGRAALKIDLNDEWTLLPQLLYQNQDAEGNFAFDPNVGDLQYGDLTKTYNKDHWYQAALTLTGKAANLDLVFASSYFKRQIDNQVDYHQYTMAYDYCCTYLPDPANPTAPLIDPTQYTTNYDTYTKVTNEFRVSSPADRRARFVAGVFFQTQTDNIRAEFRLNNLPTFYWVTGQPDILYLTQQDRGDRDSAVFGEVTYDLTDKLKVTGGLRQFNVDNTLFGFFGFNDNGYSGTGEALCFEGSPNDASRPCINTNSTQRESGETHKVSFSYQIDPDRMVYATYSTGFRPGGNNRRPEAKTWKADTLSNYELGWKTSLASHRFRFNGALFFEKWNDTQTSIQGEFGITSSVNAGDAESKGVETDIAWLAMDNLTLTLAGTYVKAKTTTAFCLPRGDGSVDPDQVNCSVTGLDSAAGTKLPATPDLKGNASARYHFGMGDHDSFVQAAVAYQGSTTYSLEAIPNQLVGDTPAFTVWDLSGGTTLGAWNLEAYIQNVTDERGELGRISECSDASGLCYANPKIYPIKPMNFGIKLGRRF